MRCLLPGLLLTRPVLFFRVLLFEARDRTPQHVALLRRPEQLRGRMQVAGLGAKNKKQHVARLRRPEQLSRRGWMQVPGLGGKTTQTRGFVARAVRSRQSGEVVNRSAARIRESVSCTSAGKKARCGELHRKEIYGADDSEEETVGLLSRRCSPSPILCMNRPV